LKAVSLANGKLRDSLKFETIVKAGLLSINLCPLHSKTLCGDTKEELNNA